jgi:hypothetical protein
MVITILARSNALHRGKAYRQLTYSAVSTLIQNELKYTHAGGKSQALSKFGWESAAWLNRRMRALVFS